MSVSWISTLRISRSKAMRAYWCCYFSYLDNIKRLTMEERGQLFTAITLYARDGETPDGMSERVEIAFDAIQAQIDRDSAEYEARCERNRANGSKGGRPAENRTVNVETQKTERLFSVPKKPKEKEKDKEKDKDKEKERGISPAKPKRDDQDFEQFWNAYPNKRSKEDARRAWDKQRPDLGVCLRAVKEQMKSRQWTDDGGRYIPYPATWINRHQWEDEPEAASQPYSNLQRLYEEAINEQS